MEMEQKDCSTKVDKLMEKHAWIASEKQLFGKTGTDYDFSLRDPRNAREELEKLQAQQSGFVTWNFLFHFFVFDCLLLRLKYFHFEMISTFKVMLLVSSMMQR